MVFNCLERNRQTDISDENRNYKSNATAMISGRDVFEGENVHKFGAVLFAAC